MCSGKTPEELSNEYSGKYRDLPDKQKKVADTALEQVVLIYDILGSGSMDYGTLTGL
ncbi:MAG: hypothetical protein KAS74_07180 [Methanosarcinales archaeon]|nr:hypothetical protein [Methanosarcinales archaeon]